MIVLLYWACGIAFMLWSSPMPDLSSIEDDLHFMVRVMYWVTLFLLAWVWPFLVVYEVFNHLKRGCGEQQD